ncbi:ABC transporter permease [Pseudooceanicola nanhaiensis]|uniref:ABC transporter permease n=1 Tax=Pseudooceanicola nanhaiensis TaxID=375761 RepID=UPI001CD2188F|nr:ABC transporter permease [Pseudooceanicola nanhaiensis]MCA0921441.1 ABC transporter permease [Pseudooceanicola nanhaiensis]
MTLLKHIAENPLLALRWLLLLAMGTLFTLANAYFLAPGNLYALGETFALLGLVALGLALTMLAGEFDLSGGAMVAVAGLIMLKCGTESALFGLLAALGFGALVGLFNGLVTLKLNVSSLVTTLGVMILLSGFAVWLEGGQAVSFANYDLTDAFNMDWFAVLSPRSTLTIALFVATGLMLAFTRMGRDIIAAGSHRKAATMAGANVPGAIITSFVLSGLFAALAGALLAITLGRASSTFGANLLLQAASAAILGGVALSGGVGRPFGVAIGVLVLAVLNNGLGLIGASSPAILLLNGAVLLIAVLAGGAPAAWLRARLA